MVWIFCEHFEIASFILQVRKHIKNMEGLDNSDSEDGKLMHLNYEYIFLLTE
jgi:hypothetical protein